MTRARETAGLALIPELHSSRNLRPFGRNLCSRPPLLDGKERSKLLPQLQFLIHVWLLLPLLLLHLLLLLQLLLLQLLLQLLDLLLHLLFDRRR